MSVLIANTIGQYGINCHIIGHHGTKCSQTLQTKTNNICAETKEEKHKQ